MEIGSTNFSFHSEKFPGVYRGTVMDNLDPGQLGKIKVKIYPMLSDVETANLPWAAPAMPLSEGAGSSIGSFAVPQIGTNVFVFFEQGNIYQPVYFAEAQDGVKGLPASRTTNYPQRKVVKFSAGIEVYVDNTANAIKITHPTGSYVIIDNNGDIKINCNRDNNVVAARDMTVNATRNIELTATEDIALLATQNISLTAASLNVAISGISIVSINGNIDLEIVGDVTAEVTGDIDAQVTGAVGVAATGAVVVSGATVDINP